MGFLTNLFTFLTEPREAMLWLIPLLVAIVCIVAVFKAVTKLDKILYGVTSITASLVWVANVWLLELGLLPASLVVGLSVLTGLLLLVLGCRQYIQKRTSTWLWWIKSLLQISVGLVLVGCGLWVAAYSGIGNTGNAARLLMSRGLWVIVFMLVVIGVVQGIKKVAAKFRALKKSKNTKDEEEDGD